MTPQNNRTAIRCKAEAGLCCASILWYILYILHSMYGHVCPADARCLADVMDDIHSTSSTSSSHIQQSLTDGQHILKGQICRIVSFQYTLVHVWHAASFVWILHTELLPDARWICSWWPCRITDLPSDEQQMPMTRQYPLVTIWHTA